MTLQVVMNKRLRAPTIVGTKEDMAKEQAGRHEEMTAGPQSPVTMWVDLQV